jgi:protein SCO1/2
MNKLTIYLCFLLLTLSSSVQSKIQFDGLLLSTGAKFTKEQISSDIKLISFFFSSCETTCLLINSKLRELNKLLLEKKNNKVSIISITVDPDYDTVSRLSTYSKKWRSSESQWLFVTGPSNEVFRVIKDEFKLPGGGYAFVHSESVIIFEDGEKKKSYSLLVDKDFKLLKSHLGI